MKYIPYILLPLLILLNLFWGSTDLPWTEIWQALCGNAPADSAAQYIVCELRVPMIITALLAGGALGIVGLLMQTLFNNPLADPSILGVNAGASLGVGVATLCLGGVGIGSAWSASGFSITIAAAFIGALIVIALLLGCALLLRSNMMLLVAGVMISYAIGAVVTLLSYFASADGLRQYVSWGMGDFTSVSTDALLWFAALILLGIGLSLLLIKPLNALLLGEQYAQNLGFCIHRLRWGILLLVGMLTAVCTALCGPIGFIGLAVPHIARLTLRTANHRTLIPTTILWGASAALLCNALTLVAGGGVRLPINAITPLLGVPVAIYILIKGRRH